MYIFFSFCRCIWCFYPGIHAFQEGETRWLLYKYHSRFEFTRGVPEIQKIHSRLATCRRNDWTYSVSHCKLILAYSRQNLQIPNTECYLASIYFYLLNLIGPDRVLRKKRSLLKDVVKFLSFSLLSKKLESQVAL